MAHYDTTPEEVLRHSIKITEKFEAEGLKLTLRQLYYQHVARGLAPSGNKTYKRIGAILTDARYAGTFPIDSLEDRGRDTGEGDWAENKDDVDHALVESARAISNCPYWYINRSRWWGQKKIASVWVEKEALAGVFADPCEKLGVALFPCKGYPSVSALWAWHREIVETREAFETELGFSPDPVILYFGDHDPDGWEIPRSALRNLYRLQELRDERFQIGFERVALNMTQIRQYKPPPFEAKITSARYASYLDEHHTDDAWELDALEPRVLQKLIKDSVTQHFDANVHQANRDRISELRDELRDRMRDPDWFDDVFDDR